MFAENGRTTLSHSITGIEREDGENRRGGIRLFKINLRGGLFEV